MGQGEKSGITWNLALPVTMLKTPPRPRLSAGQASARVSLMQVTRFLGPVRRLQWILSTGPGLPEHRNRLPRREFLKARFQTLSKIPEENKYDHVATNNCNRLYKYRTKQQKQVLM